MNTQGMLPDFEDPTTLAAHIIESHEGYSQFPKPDAHGTVQIGFGTNLTRRGLSQLEAAILVARDVADIERTLAHYVWWDHLTPARQAVLIDMAYNVGITGLLSFKETLAAVANGDYKVAAVAMLQSKWALEVPSRAKEDAEIMARGTYDAA